MWGSILCLFVLFCSSPPLLMYPSDLWSFPTALLISKDSSTTTWFCAHRFGKFFNHRLVLCSPVRKMFQPPPGFVLTGSENSSTTAWFCAHRFEVIHGHHATLRFAGTFGTGASSLVDFDLQLMICRRLLWESSFDVSAVTVIVCKLSSLVSASQTCLQMFHLYVWISVCFGVHRSFILGFVCRKWAMAFDVQLIFQLLLAAILQFQPWKQTCVHMFHGHPCSGLQMHF